MLYKLRSYRWVYVALMVALACLFVPVVVFNADHDADCCANDSDHDCFCMCHALVLNVPLQESLWYANDEGSVLSVGCSQYSLLLVSSIFRPPAV